MVNFARVSPILVGLSMLVLGAFALGTPAVGHAAAAPDCQTLLEQLDSPDFASRQAATQQLADAGTDAIPALEQAVAAGSREASARALELLQRQYQRGSEESKQVVGEALARLAASKHARTAERARQVLQPPVERTAMTPWGGVPVFPNAPRGNWNNAQLQQLQLGANGAGINAGVRRVSYSEINGKRGVEIAERDRTVKMETSPAGTIKIAITEKQNGREATRTITARDHDELARKDAETAKLYDQFHRRGGGIPGQPPGFGLENPERFGNRPLLR